MSSCAPRATITSSSSNSHRDFSAHDELREIICQLVAFLVANVVQNDLDWKVWGFPFIQLVLTTQFGDDKGKELARKFDLQFCPLIGHGACVIIEEESMDSGGDFSLIHSGEKLIFGKLVEFFERELLLDAESALSDFLTKFFVLINERGRYDARSRALAKRMCQVFNVSSQKFSEYENTFWKRREELLQSERASADMQIQDGTTDSFNAYPASSSLFAQDLANISPETLTASFRVWRVAFIAAGGGAMMAYATRIAAPSVLNTLLGLFCTTTTVGQVSLALNAVLACAGINGTTGMIGSFGYGASFAAYKMLKRTEPLKQYSIEPLHLPVVVSSPCKADDTTGCQAVKLHPVEAEADAEASVEAAAQDEPTLKAVYETSKSTDLVASTATDAYTGITVERKASEEKGLPIFILVSGHVDPGIDPRAVWGASGGVFTTDISSSSSSGSSGSACMLGEPSGSDTETLRFPIDARAHLAEVGTTPASTRAPAVVAACIVEVPREGEATTRVEREGAARSCIRAGKTVETAAGTPECEDVSTERVGSVAEGVLMQSHDKSSTKSSSPKATTLNNMKPKRDSNVDVVNKEIGKDDIDGETDEEKRDVQQTQSRLDDELWQDGDLVTADEWEHIAATVCTRGWWREIVPFGEEFLFSWETDLLAQLNDTFRKIVASKIYGKIYGEIMKLTPIPSIEAAAAWPLWVKGKIETLTDPWVVTMDRARQAGVLLARVLLSERRNSLMLGAGANKLTVTKQRPITLIGYGMGARVIIHCLEALFLEGQELESAVVTTASPSDSAGIAGSASACLDNTDATSAARLCSGRRLFEGIVENAALIGAPVSTSQSMWQAARSVVAGRLINCYATNDWLLAILYRQKSLDIGVAGLSAVHLHRAAHPIAPVRTSSITVPMCAPVSSPITTADTLSAGEGEFADTERVAPSPCGTSTTAEAPAETDLNHAIAAADAERAHHLEKNIGALIAEQLSPSSSSSSTSDTTSFVCTYDTNDDSINNERNNDNNNNNDKNNENNNSSNSSGINSGASSAPSTALLLSGLREALQGALSDSWSRDVENLDVTQMIHSHWDYPNVLPAIIARLKL